MLDKSKLYRDAAESARANREQARAFLWDRISDKATQDPQFRRSLTQDPRKVVETEARRLSQQSGEEIQDSVVDSIAERAKGFSGFLPDIQQEKVEQLIFGTIEDIRRSFSLSLILSQVLFYCGLVMYVAAFVIAMARGNETISLFFGAAGTGSILISTLVINPMNRIEKAAGNLVHLQMTYLAYYKQMCLLGRDSSHLTFDEAVVAAKAINDSTCSLMTVLGRGNYEQREAKKGKVVQDNVSDRTS